MCPIQKESKYDNVNTQIKRKEIRKYVENILKTQLYGVLATSYNGQPYTSLLAFASSEDLRNIYAATGKTSYKFQNLSNNQKVAFFIDTRSNNNFDTSNAFALTAIGEAIPVTKDKVAEIEDFYLERHPHLNSFVRSENVQFVQIKVSMFSLVERFQNVFLLEMDDELHH
jgi:nitroimidazol reductase NimA-like FMN-containing flavoprotein (pyridoxamine 5'-phosphate oxidase superfamily)